MIDDYAPALRLSHARNGVWKHHRNLWHITSELKFALIRKGSDFGFKTLFLFSGAFCYSYILFTWTGWRHWFRTVFHPSDPLTVLILICFSESAYKVIQHRYWPTTTMLSAATADNLHQTECIYYLFTFLSLCQKNPLLRHLNSTHFSLWALSPLKIVQLSCIIKVYDVIDSMPIKTM